MPHSPIRAENCIRPSMPNRTTSMATAADYPSPQAVTVPVEGPDSYAMPYSHHFQGENTKGTAPIRSVADEEDTIFDLQRFLHSEREYELRPQTKEYRDGFMSTWIDQDDTGDYLPKKGTRKCRPRRSQVRLQGQECVKSPSDAMEIDEGMEEPMPRVVQKRVVALKLANGENRAKIMNEGTSLPKNSVGETFDDFSNFRQPTNRSSKAANHVQKNGVASHPATDLTAHPAARGCQACLELDIHCSTLDDEHQWPCRTCQNNGKDCEIDTPPDFTRACESWGCRHTAGSHNDSEGHGQPCWQVSDGGFRCVAGPAPATDRTHIRYDRCWQDPMPVEQAEQAFTTVGGKTNDTRRHSPCWRTSSSEKSNTSDGSRTVEMAGESALPKMDAFMAPQRFTPPPDISSKKLATPNIQAASSISRENQQTFMSQSATPSIVGRSNSSPPRSPEMQPEGIVKTVRTKFCHPIVFNHEDASDNRNPCHFCQDLHFALFGMGTKEVKVIEWADGRGLKEIRGGHKGDGRDNTRICTSCTLSRLLIMLCPGHAFRKVSGIPASILEDTAVLEKIRTRRQCGHRLCSICPSLAVYECETVSETCHGCGLTLCGHCGVLITRLYHGDLQQMLSELKDEPCEQRKVGLRADSEMLKWDGVLMRYMLWTNR